MTNDFEADLEAIRREMDFEPNAEEQIEQRVDRLISELDEFCKLALNPETVDLIEPQAASIGMARTRCELILSFLLAKRPSKLRIVQNG